MLIRDGQFTGPLNKNSLENVRKLQLNSGHRIIEKAREKVTAGKSWNMKRSKKYELLEK